MTIQPIQEAELRSAYDEDEEARASRRVYVVTEHSLSIGPTHGSMTPDLIDRIGRRPTALVLGEDRTGFDPATGDK